VSAASDAVSVMPIGDGVIQLALSPSCGWAPARGVWVMTRPAAVRLLDQLAEVLGMEPVELTED
jgi:hypothetical protein